MAISRKSSAGRKSQPAKSKKASPRKAKPKASGAARSGKAKAATTSKARAAKARPAAKAAKVAKAAKARPAAAARKATPATAGKTKAVATKPVKGAAIPPKGSAVVKGGKAPAGKAKKPPAEVHPIGMLPAGLIARSNARPASTRPRVVVRPAPVAPAAHQGVQTVTEEDIKEFETRLLEERQRILKEMGHLESTVFKVNQRDSSGDLSGYAFHMADAGTDAMEREKAFLFASAEGRVLMEIDQALRRLYQGAYGACESCNQPIGRARLQAIPQARLCVSCKEKEERASRGAS